MKNSVLSIAVVSAVKLIATVAPQLSFATKRALLLLTFITLSSCSWLFGEEGVFPSRSDNYLNAEESADIQLPEGVDKEALVSDYPIPDLALSQVLPEKFKVPRVEPLDTVDNKGSVRIQRFEQQQWILINAAPGQTWPLIANFLTTNNIPLLVADGTRGVIETDWLAASNLDSVAVTDTDLANLSRIDSPKNLPADDSINEKYRFVIKAGIQKETTEIIVVQQAGTADAVSGNAAASGAINWRSGSSSQLREDNMVKLLSEHLANSPNQASHSLLAQGIGSASKVALKYDDSGRPYLDLHLPFDRAWASLGLALRKASYEVSDLDRSKGVYYAHYVAKSEREKKRGFFKRLFGIGKPKAEDKKGIDPMRIETRHDGSRLIISIQREAEPLLRSNEQAFMLRRIQSKLS